MVDEVSARGVVYYCVIPICGLPPHVLVKRIPNSLDYVRSVSSQGLLRKGSSVAVQSLLK
jgi:hypothetical protein